MYFLYGYLSSSPSCRCCPGDLRLLRRSSADVRRSIRHSSALEEGSFRGRAGDYFYMLLVGAIMLIVCPP